MITFRGALWLRGLPEISRKQEVLENLELTSTGAIKLLEGKSLYCSPKEHKMTISLTVQKLISIDCRVLGELLSLAKIEELTASGSGTSPHE